MAQWVSHSHTSMLDEMIRLEGRASYTNSFCIECLESWPTLHCDDCFGGELFCEGCIIKLHICNPLHNIKVFSVFLSWISITSAYWEPQHWNGLYFEAATLKSLGLCMQLGHHPGHHCVSPKPASGDDFVIIDSHSIHKVGLDYCGCEGATVPETQLLHLLLYPVTSMNLKLAATFHVMKQFHLLSFELKCSGYEFYHSVAQYMENTGVQPPWVHFKILWSSSGLIHPIGSVWWAYAHCTPVA